MRHARSGRLLVGQGIAGHEGLHFYTFGGLTATADWAHKFVSDRS